MERTILPCPYEIKDFKFGDYDFGDSPYLDLTIRCHDGSEIIIYVEQRYNAEPKSTICVRRP